MRKDKLIRLSKKLIESRHLDKNNETKKEISITCLIIEIAICTDLLEVKQPRKNKKEIKNRLLWCYRQLLQYKKE